jgi:hypothetical protein
VEDEDGFPLAAGGRTHFTTSSRMRHLFLCGEKRVWPALQEEGLDGGRRAQIDRALYVSTGKFIVEAAVDDAVCINELVVLARKQGT